MFKDPRQTSLFYTIANFASNTGFVYNNNTVGQYRVYKQQINWEFFFDNRSKKKKTRCFRNFNGLNKALWSILRAKHCYGKTPYSFLEILEEKQ